MPANPSTAQIAFERISDAIVHSRLDFGEPLSEGELSSALGMGKAPIRVAIVELKKRKLVEIVAQSGTYVVNPTVDDVRALCRFRSLLESYALESAIEHNKVGLLQSLENIVAQMKLAFSRGDVFTNKQLDARWHQCFIDHAANAFLTDAYGEISLLVEALRFRFMDSTSYRNHAFEEHQSMLDLLASNQTQRAVEMLGEHIDRTEAYLTEIPRNNARLPRKLYRMRDYAAILRLNPARDQAIPDLER